MGLVPAANLLAWRFYYLLLLLAGWLNQVLTKPLQCLRKCTFGITLLCFIISFLFF